MVNNSQKQRISITVDADLLAEVDRLTKNPRSFSLLFCVRIQILKHLVIGNLFCDRVISLRCIIISFLVMKRPISRKLHDRTQGDRHI